MAESGVADAAALDEVASIVERLAVLLAAGVAPAAAWTYLAEPVGQAQSGHYAESGEHAEPVEYAQPVMHAQPAEQAHPVVLSVVAGIRSGMGTVEAILHATSEGREPAQRAASPPVRRSRQRARGDSAAWSGLAAAWVVATEAGAPLARALREFSASLRALAQARRATATALAGPVATARLVVLLPVIGILFGMALGFDTIGTLFSTAPGIVCLVVGSALLWAARGWNRRLVHAAIPRDLTPGLELDLLAVAVSGGASIDKARASVASAFELSGCVPAHPDAHGADSVFELSRRAGIPAGALLRSEADRVRREASSAAERKAAHLAVTLMLPLGVCVLPAFMLLGVAPLMITVLSSTVTGL